MLCCHDGDCETACERPGSSVFHSVGWSVMLQWLRGEGSCMAVAFLVWWCLPPSILIDARSRLRFRRQQECGLWMGATIVLRLCCRRRVVWCGRVDVPIQSVVC
jgi:hypothetical protein